MAVDFVFMCVVCLTFLTYKVTGQTERILAYSMYEETPANTFIAEILKDAQLSLTIPVADLSTLTYSILPQSGEYTEYFSIGEKDGVLRTTRRIDRDEICYQRVSCPLKLDVAVQPREYFRIIKVTIAILDQNDSPPTFLEGHFTRSIAENTNPGASFTIPTADDPDSPKYGVKQYEMITGALQFDLKVTNNTDGSLDLHLVLKETVDREVRELYRVVIAAYDGGIPPLSGTLTLDIIILDVNDNYPHFTNETYTVSVPESLERNSVIITVKATDIDSGPNGQVVYGFSTKTQHSYGHLFRINNSTGQIHIKNKLDYEQGSTYTLSVTARDMNPESLTTMAKVIVNVRDVNDQPPKITVNALTTSGSVEIPEGESQGSLVAHISVEDPDSGLSGQFSCSLDSPMFTIQQLYGGTEYKIITSDVLDREQESAYDLEFVCEDQGNPVLTSTAFISVTVLDENDNPPTFSKQTYSAILPENNEIGASVIQINATDSDLDQNGMVEYRALGNAGNFLNVDPITGVVTSKVSFDYEQAQMLEFPIVAVDHGVPQKSSTATLIITFTDEDDSLPEFTATSYSFDVYENLPMGAEVGQVTAIDADSAPFNDFMYYTDPAASASDVFRLEPESGRILTRKPLDREYISEYQLVITAVSKSGQPQSSAVRVHIYVADKNDNTPSVIFPTRHNNTVYVEKALKTGDGISRVIVTDRDIGINSKLTYLITEGNEEGYFGVDKDTGIIYVNSEDLMKVSEKIFKLKLLIKDNGSPQKAVDTVMNIVVNKSLADIPSSSKQNLTIVVTVVVISAILTIILIIAIVLIKKRETRDKEKKLHYAQNISAQQHTLVVENGCKSAAPAPSSDGNIVKTGGATKRTRDGEPVSKREVCFNSKVQVQGEDDCKLDISVPDWDHQIAELDQMSREQGHNKDGISAHQLAMCSDPSSPRQHKLAFQNALQNIPLTVLTDKDSDSAMSNADSGRGSNEDNESSPSSPDKHDGVILKPRMSSYGQNESYSQGYASGLDHSDSFSCKPSASHKQQCTGVHRLPAGNHREISDDQSPNYVYMHSHKTHNHPYVHQPNSSRKLYLDNNNHGNYQGNHSNEHIGVHGNVYGSRHSNLDSSYAEESETEYSDEEREYVYYVNRPSNQTASHV